MVKTLCYGHKNTGSNLVRVTEKIYVYINVLLDNCPYSSKVEQNTVNICIDVQVILRACFIKFDCTCILLCCDIYSYNK